MSPDALPGSSDEASGSTTSAPPGRRAPGPDELNEQRRLEQLHSMDVTALRALAASMPVIEQAKGIVMGCYGVDADASFAVLSRVASSGNLKLRVLAASVVEAASRRTGSTQGPGPSPCERVGRVIHDALTTDERSATERA